MSGSVLSIAGLDPCGGAGLLADIKAFHQMEVTGFGVATALTFQNERKIEGVQWVEFSEIESQLSTLFDLYTIKVAKIGIVHNLDTLLNIVNYLHQKSADILIVWDPVLSSTSGFTFMDTLNADSLSEVLSKIYCITPNLVENEQLCEVLDVRELRGVSSINVILKGGHGNDQIVQDVLIESSGEELTLSNPRIEGKQVHGTGCIFSAVLSAALGKGNELSLAFEKANDYVYNVMMSTDTPLAKQDRVEL